MRGRLCSHSQHAVVLIPFLHNLVGEDLHEPTYPKGRFSKIGDDAKKRLPRNFLKKVEVWDGGLRPFYAARDSQDF